MKAEYAKIGVEVCMKIWHLYHEVRCLHSKIGGAHSWGLCCWADVIKYRILNITAFQLCKQLLGI